MGGQVVTLSSEDALLRDDYESGERRPRKGKAKSKKRRKQGRKRKPAAAVNKVSRIAKAMHVPK